MNAQLTPEVLPPTGTAIAEFSATESALADLRQQLANATFDLTTTAGNQQARQSRLALVKLRTTLEAKRKELNADDQERITMRNSEAKRIYGAIIEMEQPLDSMIKADESRREAERAERERKEAERLAAVNLEIHKIRSLPLVYVAAPANVLRETIAAVESMVLADRFDAVFLPSAQEAQTDALAGLQRALDSRVAADEAAAKLAEQQAELSRQQEAMAEAQRKADEESAAARAEADRLAKIERDRLAEEQRALNEAAQAELARVARAQQEERERLAAERAEIERVQDEALAIQEAAERTAAFERAAAEVAATQDRIDRASLLDASIGAYHHLLSLELGDEVVTRTLHAAILREQGKGQS